MILFFFLDAGVEFATTGAAVAANVGECGYALVIREQQLP
jgi:hypothetical protein